MGSLATSIVDTPLPLEVKQLVERVTGRVAPAWPLDRAIAVNPLWGFVGRPRHEVSEELRSWVGARTTMSPAWYSEALAAGRMTRSHLAAAIARRGLTWTPDDVLTLLDERHPMPPRRAHVTDVVDAALGPFPDRPCAEQVVHLIGRHCLASLSSPGGPGLYAAWHAAASRDRSAGRSLGLPGLHQVVCRVPRDPHDAVADGLRCLEVSGDKAETYLQALLFDVGGWAAACAYRRREARLVGGEDETLSDLLAVRIAWEVLLWEAGGDRVQRAWASARAAWDAPDEQGDAAGMALQVAQVALELAEHQGLARRIATQPPPRAVQDPGEVQLLCCIDVRSEVLRRAVEQVDDGVRTLGYAGFFGLPAEYLPVGATEGRPQLPGPLAPQVRVADVGVPEGLGRRRTDRLSLRSVWRQFMAEPMATFAFVDAAGLAYGPRLLTDAFGLTAPADGIDDAGLRGKERTVGRPRLVGDRDGEPLVTEARVDIAQRILVSSSLGDRRAPLVVLAAHEARAVNNAHKASLDCGACCGHSGAVNARAVAALLNDDDTREGLVQRGIDLAGTWFLPAIHETTTDEVTLLDDDLVPSIHADRLVRLRRTLADAGTIARRERAPRLRMAGSDEALHAAFRARTRDWGQVRPEWGLAGNMAFVAAPRSRTQAVDLAGRVFLHEYRSEVDADGAVLEGILTAPVVVAHWINFQYYASVVDPVRWGSGDKLLQDVVAGGLGVFEGDGGDLRIGLSKQSVRDGQRLEHQPVALGVFLEAPRASIERVLDAHEVVRHLVDHGWIHLHRIDPDGAVEARVGGQWQVVARG